MITWYQLPRAKNDIVKSGVGDGLCCLSGVCCYHKK